MKRNTDLSPVRPADVREPAAGTAIQSADCDAAMERATALLVHGMQASEAPIANLSDALAQIARKLGDAGTPLFLGEPSGAPGEAGSPELRSALARDVAVCIESLQFHDRLMQQLTQARDILSGARPGGPLTEVPNRAGRESGPEGTIELF